MKKIKAFLISIVFALSCYIAFIFTNPLYICSDNIGVAVVTDGFYGKNNFCQYIHPLLCIMIKWIYPLLPEADVFTLLVHIAIICSIALLVVRFNGNILVKPIRKFSITDLVVIILTGMAVLLFTSGIVVWNANYTIQTGAIILGGLLILFSSVIWHSSRPWIVAGICISGFGFMLRREASLLFIPFIILEIITEFLILTGKKIKEIRLKKKYDQGIDEDLSEKISISDNTYLGEIRRRVLCLCPFAIVIVLLLMSRFLFYSREPYKTAIRYNKSRTTAVDFPMKNWNDEIEAVADGVFKHVDYTAVTNRCYFDTDYLDADRLEAIAEAGTKKEYILADNGWKNVISKMRYTFLHSSLYMVILGTLTAILAFYDILCCNWWRRLETLFSLGGAVAILFYFTWLGRAPLRVWEPVIFATDFTLLISAIDREFLISPAKEKKHKTLDGVLIAAAFIVLWFNSGQLLAYMEYHQPQPVWTSRASTDNGPYEATLSKEAGHDAIFIWPNWHSHLPDYIKRTGKLLPEEIYRHNIPLGDWPYGQPYFYDFLKNINAPNPALALLKRPNTYFMGSTIHIVSSYLREHYGEDIEFEFVSKLGSIDGMEVIRIIRNGTSK